MRVFFECSLQYTSKKEVHNEASGRSDCFRLRTARNRYFLFLFIYVGAGEQRQRQSSNSLRLKKLIANSGRDSVSVLMASAFERKGSIKRKEIFYIQVVALSSSIARIYVITLVLVV